MLTPRCQPDYSDDTHISLHLKASGSEPKVFIEVDVRQEKQGTEEECSEFEARKRISATLIDRNLFPLTIGLEEHQEQHVDRDK